MEGERNTSGATAAEGNKRAKLDDSGGQHKADDADYESLPCLREGALGAGGLTYLCAATIAAVVLRSMDTPGCAFSIDTLFGLPEDLQVAVARQMLRGAWLLAPLRHGPPPRTPQHEPSDRWDAGCLQDIVDLRDETAWECVYTNADEKIALDEKTDYVSRATIYPYVRFSRVWSKETPAPPPVTISVYPFRRHGPGIVVYSRGHPNAMSRRYYSFEHSPRHASCWAWASAFVRGLGFATSAELADELSEEDAATRVLILETERRQRQQRHRPAPLLYTATAVSPPEE